MSFRGKRILIVEDEIVLAMMLQEQLEELEARVLGPAYTVEHALELLLEAEQVDAAVLDISLRGQTSERVAAALRANGVPYVVTTGFSQAELAGAPHATVMHKPYSFEELCSVLDGMLALEAQL